MTFKPMLAAATDGSNLTFPLLASPKLDGVRAVVIDGVVLSRSLKPIPNQHVQAKFGRSSLNGYDGELIVGSATAEDVFRQTSSGVMSIEGKPDVTFAVFDNTLHKGGFRERLGSLRPKVKGVEVVAHGVIESAEALQNFEEWCLSEGYEGVMLRSLDGEYKHGRSTAKQGWLLKLKRFSDSEAKVLGVSELMHNANEAKRNKLGHLERSHEQSGMVGKGTLGALHVQDVKTKVKFDIGTGFDAVTRQALWDEPPIGKLVKYKFFPGGVKDKPRFPVFIGFRDEKDL